MKLVGSNIFKEENIYLSDKIILSSKENPDSHLRIKYFSKKKPLLYKRQRWFKYGKVYNTWDEWGSKAQLDSKDVENFQFLEVGTNKIQKSIESVFCIMCDSFFEEISGEFCFIQPFENYKKAILEVSYGNKFHTECFEINKDCFISMSNRHKYNELKIPKDYFLSINYL